MDETVTDDVLASEPGDVSSKLSNDDVEIATEESGDEEEDVVEVDEEITTEESGDADAEDSEEEDLAPYNPDTVAVKMQERRNKRVACETEHARKRIKRGIMYEGLPYVVGRNGDAYSKDIQEEAHGRVVDELNDVFAACNHEYTMAVETDVLVVDVEPKETGWWLCAIM